MPGYVPPPSKVNKAKLKLDNKPKGTPGRRPGSVNKKGPKSKKASTTLSKQNSTESSAGNTKTSSKDKDSASSGDVAHKSSGGGGGKADHHHGKTNGQSAAPGLGKASSISTSGIKTTDSGIYDFQSDDAESHKAFKMARPAEREVPAKVYWSPEPALKAVLDSVVLTDVTSNNTTITVRECTAGPAFFRKRQET